MNYRAVLLDLDGTLTDRAGRLTPRTRGVLEALMARRVRIMIATGRSVSSTLLALEGFVPNAPMVCYNGAVLCDPATGRWIESRTFPAVLAAGLVEEAARAALDLFVYAGDLRYTLPSRGAEHRRLAALLPDVRGVAASGDLPREGVNRVSFMGEDAPVCAAMARLGGRYGAALYMEAFPAGIIPGFDGFANRFCDIQPGCAGKAEGIRYLREACGIPPERVIAVGDQTNDLTMLRAAGLPVAVANATPDVRAAAARTIGPHDREGVSEFLRETFGLS